MSRLVTDHLPLLAGAPNGVKKLRELILELAVRGKLVAQDPGDEPADELLKRVTLEKSRLAIDGIINKPKPSKNISSQELPFPLPDSWVWTRLGNLTELVTSGSRDWAKYYSESGAIFVRMGNLSKRSYALRLNSVQRVSPPKYEEGGRTKLEAGDLLISITGEVGLLGLVPEKFGEAYINQHVSLVRFVVETRNRYFPEFLRSPFAYAQYNAPQRGVKNSFRLGDVSELLVPVPPLAEQARIVAKVDELMALCDRLENRQSDAQAAHARLVDELLGSLLQARDAEDFAECWGRVKGSFDVLFTTEASIDAAKQVILRLAFAGHLLDRTFGADPKRPDSLPEGWCEVQISDIALVGTGATPARTNPAYFEPPEFYWVTSGETSSELINTAAQRVSALALAETNLTLYPPGTLIVAMYGQGKTRGQVSELAIEACTNQACAAIQLKEPSLAQRRYVKYFFEKSYDDLRDLAAGGAQPNLNLGKIKTTLIPLPSLADQHRIVAKLDELLDLCDRLKVRMRQARQVQERLAGTLVGRAVS